MIKRLALELRIAFLAWQCEFLFDQCRQAGGDLNPAFEVWIEKDNELRHLRFKRGMMRHGK